MNKLRCLVVLLSHMDGFTEDLAGLIFQADLLYVVGVWFGAVGGGGKPGVVDERGLFFLSFSSRGDCLQEEAGAGRQAHISHVLSGDVQARAAVDIDQVPGQGCQ